MIRHAVEFVVIQVDELESALFSDAASMRPDCSSTYSSCRGNDPDPFANTHLRASQRRKTSAAARTTAGVGVDVGAPALGSTRFGLSRIVFAFDVVVADPQFPETRQHCRPDIGAIIWYLSNERFSRQFASFHASLQNRQGQE